MAHMLLEKGAILGAIGKVMKENIIFREVKRKLYERLLIPFVVHGSETSHQFYG